MEVVRLFVVFLVVKVAVSLRVKRANFCSLHPEILNIENGSYRVKSGGSSIEFWCNEGFVLFGEEKLFCFGDRWHTRPPKCITNTCQTLSVTEPLRAEKKYDGALLKFSCAVMNRLKGPEIIICNGKRWNDATPICEHFVPPTSCTFEDQGLCGWEHHDHTDVIWRLNTGKTKTSRTGPQHDHTLGASGNGHYMYFESTDSFAKAGHKAILMSPLYPGNFSGACFSFWYHILADGGIIVKLLYADIRYNGKIRYYDNKFKGNDSLIQDGADVSLLELFVKPESKSRKDLKAVFSVHKNKGDKWIPHVVTIPQMSESFQILFVATKSNSIRSDIAIDDLSLVSCQDKRRTTETAEQQFFTTLITKHYNSFTPSLPTKPGGSFLPTVSNSTRTTTPRSSSGTLAALANSSTSSVVSPHRSTNVPVSATTTASSLFYFSTSPRPVTSTSDAKFTYKLSSVKQPVSIQTQMSTPKTISVTVTRSPSRLTTTTPETVSVTVVRQTQVHTTIRKTTTQNQSQNKTEPKTVSVAVPNQTDNDHYLTNFSTTSHGNVYTFEHSLVSQDYKKLAGDTLVNTTYIIIGVGIGFIFLVVLTFAIYYVKRKKKDRYDESVETVNLLYMAFDNEPSLKMPDTSEW